MFLGLAEQEVGEIHVIKVSNVINLYRHLIKMLLVIVIVSHS